MPWASCRKGQKTTILDGRGLYGTIRLGGPHRLARSGHRPFKPAARVQIPLGVPERVAAAALFVSLRIPTPTLPQVRKWRARGRAAHCRALPCGDCVQTVRLSSRRSLRESRQLRPCFEHHRAGICVTTRPFAALRVTEESVSLPAGGLCPPVGAAGSQTRREQAVAAAVTEPAFTSWGPPGHRPGGSRAGGAFHSGMKIDNGLFSYALWCPEGACPLLRTPQPCGAARDWPPQEQLAISDKQLAISDKQLAISDKRLAISDKRLAISDKRLAISDWRYSPGCCKSHTVLE